MSLFINIEKNFENFSLKINFEHDADILGILGASGCGKSMTLKCIAGIEKPDKGKIILDDEILFDSQKKINLPPQKRKVGYLFQNYALFPNMTVKQNILCGLHDEKNIKLKEKIFSDTIELLNLTELINHKPHELSGGQAQRTALARILVNRPKILMLDEPFSALDSHLRLKLQMKIKNLLKNYGRGVILVTHDRNEAYRMCNYIAAMDDGKILTLKDTHEFFANPESVPAAILSGCKNIAQAEKISDYKIYVPEWNITLSTKIKVKDNIKAVGIRAHHFSKDIKKNRNKITFIREMEEPFEYVIEFRFAEQPKESEPVWLRLSKDKKPENFSEELGVEEENILLLY
ncbi:MAG: ATP-binding cassette domain-containing protein [Synergistales bacterium]|nr:ATP-binding cassette domain-containing protein [Synergistales bacterium]MDY6402133.1 ATP-binding cassette domain-containing protein [Synergistales bacterium]MDY6404269.1 ATP-binding cassette domain-containing protein [Synergistales bacterium]MDY6409805.1 ATP-binding cassette domain-containing protein [Synergistales bacterium]MDY6414223.1 ATP-binding cassette domain-containing protein [Synergistales bacterium]